MLPSLTAFADELSKIAAAQLPPGEGSWKDFDKKLRSSKFRQAVIAETEDSKLKKYVKTYGAYISSKDVVAGVPSRTTGKIHKLKKLPSGRLGCSCRDWQYVRSVNGSDCDHIRMFKRSGLSK